MTNRRRVTASSENPKNRHVLEMRNGDRLARQTSSSLGHEGGRPSAEQKAFLVYRQELLCIAPRIYGLQLQDSLGREHQTGRPFPIDAPIFPAKKQPYQPFPLPKFHNSTLFHLSWKLGRRFQVCERSFLKMEFVWATFGFVQKREQHFFFLPDRQPQSFEHFSLCILNSSGTK